MKEVLEKTQAQVLGTYLAKGTIGNVGLPGAPIAHFALLVVPSQNKVTGTVEVTQAVVGGRCFINVEGRVRHTGYGAVTKIVVLEGEYQPKVDWPKGGGIGPVIPSVKFTAYLDIDDEWNGQGGFSLGGNTIEGPVKSEN